MYGKFFFIDSNVSLHSEPSEHIDYSKTYSCEDIRCFIDLCECDIDHDGPELSWKECPNLPKSKEHTHPVRCPECERLILKETSEMLSKILKG